MYEQDLVIEILNQINIATARITRRFSGVETPDEFLDTDEGLDRLDSICMMLIAIGESLKKLDRITSSELLSQYPTVDWKGAKGIRDVISHHYFDLNAEAVFNICQERIPGLIEAIKSIKADLEKKK